LININKSVRTFSCSCPYCVLAPPYRTKASVSLVLTVLPASSYKHTSAVVVIMALNQDLSCGSLRGSVPTSFFSEMSYSPFMISGAHNVLRGLSKQSTPILLLPQSSTAVNAELSLCDLHEYSLCWAPVAHACNPSYSGGRDLEDRGSNPAWANSSQDPISKTPFTIKGWRNGSRP
jgi:hypothetical protein